MQKYLVISKICCTFALDLKRSPLSSLKWFTNMYLTYSRLCLFHISENCCKVSKKFLNTQIIMKKIIIQNRGNQFVCHVNDVEDRLPNMPDIVAAFDVSDCFIHC